MEIRKNEEVNLKYWNDLLISSPFSSPFQTPDFYEFYNKVNNFSADVFAIQEEKKILGLVVVTLQKEKGFKAYFSRRGIIYGGPVLSENIDLNSYECLLKHISNFYKRKTIYIEIRNLIINTKKLDLIMCLG